MRVRLLHALFLLPLTAQANINTELDRYSITTQDTVRLTLEVSQPKPAPRPDFSALQQNFLLLGSKRMSISNRNSNAPYTTRWQVLLRPLRTGQIDIPAFQINGERSRPLTLQVVGQGAEQSRNTASARQKPAAPDLLLEAALDYNEAYQGSQLIYTVKALHRAPLRAKGVFTEPFLDRALILPFGDVQTTPAATRESDYHLTQQRYLIFPDQTGNQLIEPPFFRATTRQGRTLEATTEATALAVIPPANTNSLGYWLPSLRVTLADDMDIPDYLEPGSQITRKLTLSAQGIPAARLPAIASVQGVQVQISKDNITLNEQINQEGLLSTRTETLTITLTQEGSASLPPIDIHWWNTYEDRAKVASLPPRLFTVQPRTLFPEPVSADTQQAPEEAAARPAHPLRRPAPVTTPVQAAPATNIGYLWPVLLATSCLLALVGWVVYRKRQQRPAQTSVSPADITRQMQLEQQRFRDFASACRQNNPALAQQRLISWAQAFWPDQTISSCKEVSQSAANASLEFLLVDLEQHLNSRKTSHWQGDLLLQAIARLRRRTATRETI